MGAITLHPYQAEVTRFERATGAILYWPCGSGKTWGAARLLELWRPNKVLVITRATVKRQWCRALRRYFDAAPIDPYDIYGVRAEPLPANSVIVISYEILPYWIDHILAWMGDTTTVVYDEVHEVKQWRRTTRNAITGKETFLPNIVGAAVRISRKAQRRMGTTATILRDRRVDIWGQVDMIYPDALGSNWEFIHRYCGAVPGKHGGMDTTGKTNTEGLKAKLAPLIYKVSKEVVDQYMPKMRIEVIRIHSEDQSSGLSRAVFTAAAKAGRAMLRETQIEDSCKRKFKWFRDHIDEFKGRRTFIATTRKRVVATLQGALEKIGIPVLVSVDDSIEERLEKIAQVTSVDESTLIGTVDAFGESIDGMQHFDEIVLLTLPVNQGILEQFMGRFKRLGGRECRFRIVLAEHTIDDDILGLLTDKYEDYVDIFDEAEAGALLKKMKYTRPEEETLANVLQLLGS